MLAVLNIKTYASTCHCITFAITLLINLYYGVFVRLWGRKEGKILSMLSNGGWSIRTRGVDIHFKPAKYGNYVQWQASDTFDPARKWYVPVASVFPLADHNLAVLAWGS
jgi:hypothetical protein